jgi:lipopolysaccharide assembly protein A
MRLIRILVALACLAAGIIVGALNPLPVTIDFGFTHGSATLGVTILLSLLAGVLAGGLAVMAGVVLPLRQRLRKAAIARGASSTGDGT